MSQGERTSFIGSQPIEIYIVVVVRFWRLYFPCFFIELPTLLSRVQNHLQKRITFPSSPPCLSNLVTVPHVVSVWVTLGSTMLTRREPLVVPPYCVDVSHSSHGDILHPRHCPLEVPEKVKMLRYLGFTDLTVSFIEFPSRQHGGVFDKLNNFDLNYYGALCKIHDMIYTIPSSWDLK